MEECLIEERGLRTFPENSQECDDSECAAAAVIECAADFFADELLPFRGFHLRDEPVAHREQDDDGDEHCEALDYLTARRKGAKYRLKNDRHHRAGDKTESDSRPDRAETVAVACLDQKRDDRTDNEYRFEAFTDDYQERLQERPPAACRWARQLDNARKAECDRVARALGDRHVPASQRALEVSKMALHRRHKTGLARPCGSLQWLECDVGIERPVAGFGDLPGACELEGAVEKSEH